MDADAGNPCTPSVTALRQRRFLYYFYFCFGHNGTTNSEDTSEVKGTKTTLNEGQLYEVTASTSRLMAYSVTEKGWN